jgi:hypothetical protein
MALTVHKVKNAPPGKLTDGEVKGLRLDVDPRGGRSWVCRGPVLGVSRSVAESIRAAVQQADI